MNGEGILCECMDFQRPDNNYQDFLYHIRPEMIRQKMHTVVQELFGLTFSGKEYDNYRQIRHQRARKNYSNLL